MEAPGLAGGGVAPPGPVGRSGSEAPAHSKLAEAYLDAVMGPKFSREAVLTAVQRGTALVEGGGWLAAGG